MIKRILLSTIFTAALCPVVSIANRIEDLSKDEVLKEPAKEKQLPVLAALPSPATLPAFVVGIYGRDAANLTAEIVDQQQFVTVNAGTTLPSGFVVRSIGKNAVLVEKTLTKRHKKTVVIEKQLNLQTPAFATGVGTSTLRTDGVGVTPLPVVN